MNDLLERFLKVRQKTLDICKNLETEDFVIQPTAFVSPIKWHIGHVTWFFDKLIAQKVLPSFQSGFSTYDKVFNSYYKSQGQHWIQERRGDLSRPTLNSILEHRKIIDSAIIEILSSSGLDERIKDLIIIGINHEEQHQELILMDIKYILSLNIENPIFEKSPLPISHKMEKINNFILKEGIYELGHNASSFSYDNELPAHKVYLHGCELDNHFVSNGDYLEFIKDKAYENPNLWLSDGWDWIQETKVKSPLYWRKGNSQWKEFTLHGEIDLDLHSPVSHVNYYEADAFAKWKGKRLPLEAELEQFYNSQLEIKSDKLNNIFHSTNTKQLERNLWTWTQSPYTAYPGYKPFDGDVSEYNGKFMCNQYVLRGGCLFNTPEHYRKSYRNFYRPDQSWMFSGIRLAKDIK
ncbi:ergothioneine biosynthesis protein EgtB [Halobacteriovorax sp.]|uniref:ergothioneine biosynthesis protein EgtB n=1 Tax=Halobacteriovorax sp. TaxID=2020862 RepID=UPI0035644C16